VLFNKLFDLRYFPAG